MQRSTEYGGVGQSGYTAGRARDPALERDILTRNTTIRGADEDDVVRDAPTTDDRWTGRGGPTVRD